jgi:hypothetical protein
VIEGNEGADALANRGALLPVVEEREWKELEQEVRAGRVALRHKNAKFASVARSGKKPTNPSRQELLAKRSPIPMWALGIIVFVVVGGGESRLVFTGCSERG